MEAKTLALFAAQTYLGFHRFALLNQKNLLYAREGQYRVLRDEQPGCLFIHDHLASHERTGFQNPVRIGNIRFKLQNETSGADHRTHAADRGHKFFLTSFKADAHILPCAHA
jgi:hypothetical protein